MNNPNRGPFPLSIQKSDDHFIIITNQGNHFAKTFDPFAARLIASAPELLQVAKDYVLLCQLHGLEGAVLDSARAAIAKAEGVQC